MVAEGGPGVRGGRPPPDDGRVSIAARFEDALRDAGSEVPDEPELLPVRLSVACARVLGVDGAGISLAGEDGQRIPLGANSELAARTERLQFTAGEGPCATAQAAREPVFADLGELRRRWLSFAELLERETPYRGVVALPLHEAIAGLGAIDLYFEDDGALTALDVFEAMAVGELVATSLSEAAVWSEWPAERGPGWLHGPSAEQRAAVWEATGLVALALDLDAAPALDLLRDTARAGGRTVDDVAADLLAGTLQPDALRAPERAPRD
jgi:hypothetical protein